VQLHGRRYKNEGRQDSKQNKRERISTNKRQKR